MTDSMKFGPEWLRNMSADTISPSSINLTSQISSACLLGVDSVNSESASNGTSVNNVTNNRISRSTFPEFRYGREEMLLLFNRNCAMPQILPSYKSIFVERVQLPLALVPSTDEDLIQGSALQPQRPGWLQRSPVSFTTSTRGSGRVGCIERGRIRGKAIYNPVFQRPNIILDEEVRSSAFKTDRGWSERNGCQEGDQSVSGSSLVCVGLVADTWNENTPVASPRREITSYSRNMENWRRSRNEDGSGGETNFPLESGWRMNTSGFQNPHTRWNRSTSWRDEELCNKNENSYICGNNGSSAGFGGGAIMIRSNSSISSDKQTNAPEIIHSITVTSSAPKTTHSSNSWPNTTLSGQTSNMQSITNDEVALPEWAMENPSVIGGTFDASGAFHGTTDDDDNVNQQLKNELSVNPPSEEAKLSGSELDEELFHNFGRENMTILKHHKNSSLNETGQFYDSESSHNAAFNVLCNKSKSAGVLKNSEKSKQTCKNITIQDLNSLERVAQQNTICQKTDDHEIISDSDTNTNVQNYSPRSDKDMVAHHNAGDDAERMMKVTGDMIEKLIMDEEEAKDNQMKLSPLSLGNKINSNHVLKPSSTQLQNFNHLLTVSPALAVGEGPSVPPHIGLYNMGGVIVGDTLSMPALHHIQQQQIGAVSSVSIGLQTISHPHHPMPSAASSDLWLYRDPQTKIQGPFSALEMTEWYRAGYFNENLSVRRVCDLRFRSLGELIKICNGQMPFSHSHLIPIDLNHTQVTPPLGFVNNALHDQQNLHQHDKLKSKVTAAANSLSNALKSLTNGVDLSEVLNMHFRTLQDRYFQNEELEIANDLSQNECFQRLSAAEQDTFIRKKLQLKVLPEYLTNLTGLSHSLAALNPPAGSQLYDAIAECSKKEQMFSNHRQLSQTSPQHTPTHLPSLSPTPFKNAESLLMNKKGSAHNIIGNNNLVNKLYLRMASDNDSDSGAGDNANIAIQSFPGHEVLNDLQLTTTRVNAPKNTTQSPMIQMWMNSIADCETNSIHSQKQQPFIGNAHQETRVNNQWPYGSLVGIAATKLAREQHGSGVIMDSLNPTTPSMWDVTTLEHHVHIQQLEKQKSQQLQLRMQEQSFENRRNLNNHILIQDQHLDATNQHKNTKDCHEAGNPVSELLMCKHAANNAFPISDNNIKEEKHDRTAFDFNEKSKSNTNNHNITDNNSAQLSKSENFVQQDTKKTDEDHCRDLNEEKRRQKDERKRQHIVEEKRRVMLLKEEKSRQVEEEEEQKRQQQIQFQRRKALASNTSISNFRSNNNSNANNSNDAGNQKSKELQRIQSSVAPWLSQTMTTKSQGPGLAEIQKAERRERRADQQRQLEIQEKLMREIAISSEAQDTALKWNAAPMPVKNFSEIQAEEAERLASEQIELQRRKELEAHNNYDGFTLGGNPATGCLNSSSNISGIWSGNKIWGTPANTSGFWDDHKCNSKTLASVLLNSDNINNISNVNITSDSIISQSSTVHQKSATAQHQLPLAQPNKNIKKYQSVGKMRNTVSSQPSSSTSAGANNQKKSNNAAPTTKSAGGNDNKKSISKNYNEIRKGDSFDAEFTNWCIKTINIMNTKVDVPTFVSFLRDLESPYEVKDYIRIYLGETKEYADFAKQFLERRSKYKNLQRAQNAHDDDLCKPAQAITPSVNDNNDNKGKQKKPKKNKMTKLDARILGFSVTAAEGRTNVGDRDYGDIP